MPQVSQTYRKEPKSRQDSKVALGKSKLVEGPVARDPKREAIPGALTVAQIPVRPVMEATSADLPIVISSQVNNTNNVRQPAPKTATTNSATCQHSASSNKIAENKINTLTTHHRRGRSTAGRHIYHTISRIHRCHTLRLFRRHR